MNSSRPDSDQNFTPVDPMALASFVGPSTGLHRDLTMGKWHAQYGTTNYVAMSKQYVLKNYLSRNNFEVERSVCSQHTLFSFEMAHIVESVDDPCLGMWNIFERIRGDTLYELLPSKDRMPSVLDAVVDALVSFEGAAPGLTGISFRKWTLPDALRPLVSACRDRGFSATAEALSGLASEADRALQSAPRVPCFDLFLRNIIWRPVGVGIFVAHIDFDKADRLVWSGEQLSHIAVSPSLRPYLDRAINRYAVTSGLDRDLLAQINEVGRFFRALAGIRDSMPRKDGSETVANAAAREQSRIELLHFSGSIAPALISRLGLGHSWLRWVRSALADLERMALT